MHRRKKRVDKMHYSFSYAHHDEHRDVHFRGIQSWLLRHNQEHINFATFKALLIAFESSYFLK
jgi:hypothetical protein